MLEMMWGVIGNDISDRKRAKKLVYFREPLANNAQLAVHSDFFNRKKGRKSILKLVNQEVLRLDFCN